MSRKIKVLIDSDVCNEVDDAFALCYAFARQDVLDILGVTICPFRVSWNNSTSIREGMIDSRNEVWHIMRLFGVKHTAENPFVYLGCDGYLSEGYNGTNPAVEKIIQLAKRYKKITICAIGTLTNVAMALRIEPSIAKKLRVLWLGTGNILLDEFKDSNFRKDKVAFYEVLASEVEFEILPSYLTRDLITSVHEFGKNARANNVSKHLARLLKDSKYMEKTGDETYGVFDLGLVEYLLHPEKYITKELDAKDFVKEKGVKCPHRQVTCVVEVPRHTEIWKDFYSALNEVKNYYLKPNIFFISDTHFSHERKVRFKQVPFKTVEEMNSELVRRWNSVVGKNDIVYHLGDFGDYDFIKKLNGKVILICGNYEREDFINFNKFREKLIGFGFHDVIKKGIYLDEKVLGSRVYLTHKPTDRAKNCPTLFGHVHTLKGVASYGFNVCCTYHYFQPISTDTAKRYLDFVVNHADQDVFE